MKSLVWQLILTIALLVCSGFLFYLSREIRKLEKLKNREPSTPSAIPQ